MQQYSALIRMKWLAEANTTTANVVAAACWNQQLISDNLFYLLTGISL